MSKLLSVYARSTGLKIKKPYMRENFYPLTTDKFITIQTGSNQGAKNYDYFQEVVVLLKPILDSNGISIIHLGGKDDPMLNGVIDLRGKTTLPQSNFILKRTLLHLGNDSWMQHISCFYKIPTIALFGSTSIENHSSYWANEKSIFIESHRNGNKPTYMSQENPKVINFITPESVANSVIKLLSGNSNELNFKTILIGQIYNHTILELIPNFIIDGNLLPQLPLSVRMDYHFDENILFKILETGRKINLITNKKIDNINLLTQNKNNVLSISYEVSLNDDPNYLYYVKNTFNNVTFFSKLDDKEKLSEIRFKFFDIISIESYKELNKDFALDSVKKYTNDPNYPLDFNRLKFKTNKFIFSSGQIYTSFAHLKNNSPIPSLNENLASVIDDQEFWKDINSFYLIEKI